MENSILHVEMKTKKNSFYVLDYGKVDHRCCHLYGQKILGISPAYENYVIIPNHLRILFIYHDIIWMLTTKVIRNRIAFQFLTIIDSREHYCGRWSYDIDKAFIDARARSQPGIGPYKGRLKLFVGFYYDVFQTRLRAQPNLFVKLYFSFDDVKAIYNETLDMKEKAFISETPILSPDPTDKQAVAEYFSLLFYRTVRLELMPASVPPYPIDTHATIGRRKNDVVTYLDIYTFIAWVCHLQGAKWLRDEWIEAVLRDTPLWNSAGEVRMSAFLDTLHAHELYPRKEHLVSLGIYATMAQATVMTPKLRYRIATFLPSSEVLRDIWARLSIA